MLTNSEQRTADNQTDSTVYRVAATDKGLVPSNHMDPSHDHTLVNLTIFTCWVCAGCSLEQ